MKKKILIIAIIAACCLAVILTVHFTKPETRIKGTWQGDGTLDLLAETAFDGAVEITFFSGNRGIVKGNAGEAEFRYSLDTDSHPGPQCVFVDIEDRTLSMEYRIDGDRLTLDESVFIKMK